MVSNAFLDIAVGLSLMYLLLSLFCTILNELIATILGLRAQSLRLGIEQLLDDPRIRVTFYDHGLIRGTTANSRGGQTSANDHPSYISGQTFAMALVGSLNPTKPIPVFSDLESAVINLPASSFRDSMLAQLTTADVSITKFRDAIAIWFDQSMDRLSGAYKRKIKFISCGVGLILALVMNADTIKVAQTLWQDADLRASIVQAATPVLTASASVLNQADHDALLNNVMNNEQVLRHFPLGWDFNKSASGFAWRSILLKFLGTLLTAVAITLGAPFWFDILSKFMQVRGTGAKPDRTVPD